MSRYSLNSTLALFQSVLTDPDATSSSTSSSSNVNNSSNSLSVSPAIERQQQQQQQHHDGIRLSMNSSQMDICLGATKRQPASNHLLELQREIKEEEDEIFADINSLINNRSELYASFNETARTDYDEEINDSLVDDEPNCHHFDSNAGRQYLSSSYEDDTGAVRYKDEPRIANHGEDLMTRTAFAARSELQLQFRHIRSQQRFTTDDNDDQQCSYNQLDARVALDGQHDDEQLEEQSFHHQQISSPCNRVVQLQQQRQHQEHQQEHHEQLSSHGDVEAELEICNDGHEDENNDAQNQDMLQQFQQQQLHNSQAMQQVTSNLPKPCVFFLEGNCRRSDCKYSHDLSSITCKYWIEGFCFKGELCPFLHSFNSSELPDSSLFDDDGVALSKKELIPKFTIESEADFPSLPLDAQPGVALGDGKQKIVDPNSLTKSIKNQILSSNPAVVFKSSKKKRKKG